MTFSANGKHDDKCHLNISQWMSSLQIHLKLDWRNGCALLLYPLNWLKRIHSFKWFYNFKLHLLDLIIGTFILVTVTPSIIIIKKKKNSYLTCNTTVTLMTISTFFIVLLIQTEIDFTLYKSCDRCMLQ